MDASTLTRKPPVVVVAAGWAEVGPGADARSRLVMVTTAGRAKRAEAQRE
jgi:DNA-binding MarR family transcriptional regulator